MHWAPLQAACASNGSRRMIDVRRVPPPRSEAELLARADAIAGRTLGDVAATLGLSVPETTRRGKGWTGTVIEHALGASAGSLPEPDFRLISVELKTIPIRPGRRPLESTYVCTVPLAGDAAASWRDSNVRRKLARVLWMPFEGDRTISLSDRRIGSALLWSPSADEDSALANDWETLMDRVVLGRVDEISAREGECLQIRPKAANAASRRRAIGSSGAWEPALPRGFYLRASFTAAILARHYA